MWIRSPQDGRSHVRKGRTWSLVATSLPSALFWPLLRPACPRPLPRDLDTVTLDWAYYNPVSLVLKQKGWLEEELRPTGSRSNGCRASARNKALEFLNAGSLDFGSTAGAAALLAKVKGNPIKTIYIYSKPEWTALVTRPETGIAKVEDLKGKRIAVTKGTDPLHLPDARVGRARPERQGCRHGPAAARPGPPGAGTGRRRRLGRALTR